MYICIYTAAAGRRPPAAAGPGAAKSSFECFSTIPLGIVEKHSKPKKSTLAIPIDFFQ